MGMLREEDWPGFKFTLDHTLAFKKFADNVVYIRSVDENVDPNSKARSSFGIGQSWGESGIEPPRVGILYKWDRWVDFDDGFNECIAVFAGINPYECNEEIDGAAITAFKEYLADNSDRYSELKPVFDIRENDQLYRLAVPFNRNNGGFMPIIWNLGAMEPSKSNLSPIRDITSVSQLEEKFPAVDLEAKKDKRYIMFKLAYGKDSILFGYNRNHIAYNGKVENDIANFPISSAIPMSYYYGNNPMTNAIKQSAKADKSQFNGKATSLFDAAGLAGKA